MSSNFYRMSDPGDEKKAAKAAAKEARDAVKEARRKAVGARIRQQRKRKGLSPAQLADRFDPPLTDKAVLNWELGKASPTSHNMQQLADILDTSSTWLEHEKGESPALSGEVPTVSVPVKGEVGDGMGIDRLYWPDSKWYHVRVEVPKEVKDDPALHGRRLAGPSMDLIYPADTVVVCAPHNEGDDLVNGRRYVVKRHRPDGEPELFVRELQWHKDGWWLMPRSSQPEYQVPTRLHPLPEGETLEIAFRIVSRTNIEP